MRSQIAGRARLCQSAFVLLLCVLLAGWAGAGWAQDNSDDSDSGFQFDHFKVTGFALEGMHAEIECESCHSRGVFKGTPRRCVDCHAEGSPVNASAKPIHHILAIDTCDDCHTPDEWTFVERVDHAAVLGTCLSCHNNFNAKGKPANHINVGDTGQCDDCHITAEWVTVRFEHSIGAVEAQPCAACHIEGGGGTPKHAQHLTTSQNCENCHVTSYWKPAMFDHADPGIPVACFACHNNNSDTLEQGAVGKSTQHLDTSNTCDNCHITMAWIPANFDHGDSRVAALPCVSCHDGSSLRRGQGAKGKVDSIDPEGHINASDNCDACHMTTMQWSPIPRGGVDHGEIPSVDNCASCHQELRDDGHPIEPITNNCSACHNTSNWFNVMQVDHGEILSDQCLDCHNGTFRIITGLVSHSGQAGAWHQNTSNNCEGCHLMPGMSWGIAASPKISLQLHTLEIPGFDFTNQALCGGCHGVNGSPAPPLN